MGRRSSDVVQEIRFGMTDPMKALLSDHMEAKKVQAYGTSAAAVISSGGLIRRRGWGDLVSRTRTCSEGVRSGRGWVETVFGS